MLFFVCPVGLLMSFSILYLILQSFFLYVTHGMLPTSPWPSQPFSNCLYVGIYALFVFFLSSSSYWLYIPTPRPSMHMAKTARWNQAISSRQVLLKLIAYSRFISNLDNSQGINQRGSMSYRHKKSFWGKFYSQIIDITLLDQKILVFENLWSRHRKKGKYARVYTICRHKIRVCRYRAWDLLME